MNWSDKARRALAALGETDTAALPPALRVLVAALRRADGFAAERVLGVIAAPLTSLQGPGAPTGSGRPRTLPLRMLLIKPVGDVCNLACRYCYESLRRLHAQRGTMTRETLRRIHENVLPYVDPPFTIYYHGGEPLLRGGDFFRAAVSLARELRAPESTEIGVQTNATLIDREWAEFFREHDVRVGVSLDGDREVNDAGRVTTRGAGSYERAVEGIRHLQAVGLRFGTIAVLTPDHARRPGAARALLEHFQGLGIREFDVHPAFSVAPDSGRWNLSPADYAGFMIELFDAWLAAGDSELLVRSFDHFYQGMTGIHADACYRAGKCTTILGVDPTGEAVPCTRPFDARYRFGNLAEQPLPAIMRAAPFQLFQEHEAAGQRRTRDCTWSMLCGHGACPHERRSAGTQAVDGVNVYCTCFEGCEGGYPAIFSHLYRVTEELLESAVAGVRA
ncbi:MAG: radical SAM protein [Gemmatimonadetes bacterium]|nr:radical SAM protein [Gemmatimonadota bacterium]